MNTHYDLIVIGSGPGGYIAAAKAAELGNKAAVIESREIGGTCLNRGCIPTKTLLHSANLYYEMKNGEKAGIEAESIRFNIEKIRQRKEEVVDGLRDGIKKLMKQHKIDVIQGRGQIISNKEVIIYAEEAEQKITGDKILIATGSEAFIPPIEGTELPGVVTSDEIVSMKNGIYKKLLIIGGGVIGIEIATIYQQLGMEVIVVEARDRILPGIDKEISRSIALSLKKKGVQIFISSVVEKITKEDSLTCYFKEKDSLKKVEAEGILVAAGRKGNTEGLFSDDVTIHIEKGLIQVDEKFQTNISGIYAIGDAIKGFALAHMASAQGIAAVEMMNGRLPSIDVKVVPSCIYTVPEAAWTGMTEEEAKERGYRVKTGKYPMLANCKTVLSMDERGYIKVVVDEKTDKILGAQMICARATDMIGEMTTAIVNGLTRQQLLSVIRPHPTYEEGITEVLNTIF